MEAWVIKRDDGKYYIFEDFNYGFGEINKAVIFEDINLAKRHLENIEDYTEYAYEILKIWIEEVEEDE